MTGSLTEKHDGLSRRQAIGRAGQGLVGLAALAHMSASGARTAAGAMAPRPAAPAKRQSSETQPAEKLRVATCQFPVGGQIVDNAKYIRDCLHQAAAAKAHLLHTSEASLSGYPGADLPSFKDFDWDIFRIDNRVVEESGGRHRSFALWGRHCRVM